MDEIQLYDKYEVLKELIEKIDEKRDKQYKRYKRLRTITSVIDTSSNILNSITVSSLATTLAIASPSILILTSVSSTIVLIMTAARTGYSTDLKKEKYNTAYHQYNELSRSLKVRLAQNNLSREDIDEILADINNSMSLIEDSSIE